MLKKNFFLIFVLMLLMLIGFGCNGKTPFEPDLPQYAQIHTGIYERIYTSTTNDYRLPGIAIWPTEVGGMSFKTEEDGENRFKFQTGKVLKPNYPKGKAYQIQVNDLRVWIEERRNVARDLYLNGRLIESVATIGDEEIGYFRIDKNNVVYNAFDSLPSRN